MSLFNKDSFVNVKTLGFTIQVQTQDQGFDRTLVLQQGKLHLSKSKSILSKAPSEDKHIKIIFDSAQDAFKLSNELRKDKHKIFNMIQEQKITIEGDFSVIQTIFSFKEMLDQA